MEHSEPTDGGSGVGLRIDINVSTGIPVEHGALRLESFSDPSLTALARQMPPEVFRRFSAIYKALWLRRSEPAAPEGLPAIDPELVELMRIAFRRGRHSSQLGDSPRQILEAHESIRLAYRVALGVLMKLPDPTAAIVPGRDSSPASINQIAAEMLYPFHEAIPRDRLDDVRKAVVDELCAVRPRVRVEARARRIVALAFDLGLNRRIGKTQLLKIVKGDAH